MKRILIVEDETALLEVYTMLFSTQDFDVHAARDGKLALEKLPTIKPDIIVLDVLMPVMGGLEFLEKANLKKKHPRTKVLVLSNLSDPDTLEQIENLGADKYLLKASVSPAELVGSVNQLLATK